MNIQKQCLGIDVSKDNLDCCLAGMDENQSLCYSTTKSFANNPKGFNQLLKWVNRNKQASEVLFVMEATGVYYEHFAYWLHEQDLAVSVMLPNKVKHFSKSHNIKTKTDEVDSRVLGRMGLERKLPLWKIPSKVMREVKFLTREYQELKVKLTALKNQFHAKEHSYDCPKSTFTRLKKLLRMLESQVLEVEAQLRVLVMSDSNLNDKIDRIQTIPGISFITIICILGETNAFALVKNSKQLVSYCGLDIMHNQSGIKKGKTRISKKGNSFIRRALYMPAMCAAKYNPTLNAFYQRLVEKKSVKKIGITAVARKLLVLMFTLWKNDTVFDSEYLLKKAA